MYASPGFGVSAYHATPTPSGGLDGGLSPTRIRLPSQSWLPRLVIVVPSVENSRLIDGSVSSERLGSFPLVLRGARSFAFGWPPGESTARCTYQNPTRRPQEG